MSAEYKSLQEEWEDEMRPPETMASLRAQRDALQLELAQARQQGAEWEKENERIMSCLNGAGAAIERQDADLAQARQQITDLQAEGTRLVLENRRLRATNSAWNFLASYQDSPHHEEVAAILGDIATEYARACVIHPVFPADTFHALNILGEEYGEAQKAANDNDHAQMLVELVQAGAMAVRCLVNLTGGKS